jgi:1,4-alpha-glucan branching enzyme
MAMPPIHRKWHHNLVTFSFMYAFSENFLLALSHDEVVHGKKSLLDKMPGDYWQKFANLRCFYAYMMAHPGKKLLFMGGEFGQFVEWRYQSGLDWNLLGYDMHQKLQNYVRDLNFFYRQENVLWEEDHSWRGFQWIDPHDYSQSVITFLRSGHDPDDIVLVVCNFTPEVRHGYRIGVPKLGAYEEVFNSDWEMYGGSGQQNSQMLKAEALTWHNQPCSLELCIPPLATIYLKPK